MSHERENPRPGATGRGQTRSAGTAQNKDTTLADAMAAHGLTPPDNIEPGRIVRFPGSGKPASNRAGWLKLFPDGEGAVFGDWSTGLNETWQARKPANDDELQRWRKLAEQAQAEAEAERHQKATKAAQTAADTWSKAEDPDGLHGYLVAKDIEAHGIKQDGDDLLIPVYVDNMISSIQRIKPNGDKKFLHGGKIKAGHFIIGEPCETVVIAEGYATGASIFESTGHPVAVAFNAGQLKPVAEHIRNKHPDAKITIAADDDRKTEGNPGIKAATDASQAVRGYLATPGTDGDFNDLHQAEGADAVRTRIKAATRPGELEIVSIEDLDKAEIPDPLHIVEKLLPAGVASSLASHGGKGKTTLATHAGVSVAMGRPFMGLEVEQVPVLFYSAEDGADITRYRLKRIIENEDIAPGNLAKWLHIIDATDIDPALFIERNERDDFGSTKRGLTTPVFKELTEKAKDLHARLVIIDNASDTFEANENERARVRGFIRALAQMARAIDGAVLLLSHVDKATAKTGGNSEGYSGSTAWHNSVRSRMFLHGEGRNLTLEHQKANFGPMADDLHMHWHEGVLMAGHVEGQSDSDLEGDLKHTAQILNMIHQRFERGDFISTSRGVGNAYLVLSPMREFPKVDKRTFWRLIDQAEESGKITREEYRAASRKPKERFSVTPAGLSLIQAKQ